MGNLTVSNSTLFFAALLVLVSLGIVYKERLGLEKDIIISVVRAIVQLTIVGYVLKYIFKVDNIFLTLAMVLIIILNAGWNAAKRSQGVDNAFVISLVAIGSGTAITLALLVVSGSIKWVPSQIVPISGMIASNSMVAIGLSYKNMGNSFREQYQQLQEKLALGATPMQASKSIIRESIRMGVTPTIDSTKTLGIVSLPGMMSGLMFAGVDPVRAIKYQIMVVFMLLSTTSIASVIACYWAYSKYYNEQMQLKE